MWSLSVPKNRLPALVCWSLALLRYDVESFAPLASPLRTTSNPPDVYLAATDNQSTTADPSSKAATRRSVVARILGTALIGSFGSEAFAADDDFESIAARASKISQDLNNEAAQQTFQQRKSDKSAYDFALPVESRQVPITDLIQQQVTEDSIRVKAIVVVNIKQDDPVARKTIPELISLAAKYGRDQAGSLAVIACPTDQGYYEPDTSALIRLKLASEYGYGINPATTVSDKLNLLGSGADPFWRWLQSTCRTPAGLGRIQGNFEKFLIDGRTGQPLRRYPRKYAPLDMRDDIEAVIAGKPLPPARANFMESWRAAAVESERDTYRFEKGLNYFDQ